MQHLPHYPSEILPLFLYLGEKRDACNVALNSDLKINSHVVLGEDIAPVFPGKIESLHINIRDSQEYQLPCDEIYEFIGKLLHRKVPRNCTLTTIWYLGTPAVSNCTIVSGIPNYLRLQVYGLCGWKIILFSIESCWQKSYRVLVYEESGCSMSAVAVIVYLMKKNNMQLKVSAAGTLVTVTLVT